jgi:3'-phosphoadenosine 5'-phosphosulfate sulfotransferase (PAPS reductase)/FAD synthetase
MSEDLREEINDLDWLAEQGLDISILRGGQPSTPAPLSPLIAADVDPNAYDRICIAFSGGKDSLALLLHVLELGVPKHKIELHHHLVDGREGSTLMDWPITESYCEEIAKAFGVPLTFSWREGGIEQEMLREQTATGAVFIPDGEGHRRLGGDGPAGTRRKFPQVSADLSVRWCSGVAKIDCFSRYLNNHPKFTQGKTLVLTGERAQESSARSRYQVFEPHRCDLRNGRKVKRHIDVWRAVHSWSEQQVWEIIERWRVCAHPCYWLGWGRASCRACVFGGKDEWATIRVIAPQQFAQIVNYEREFKVTIHRKDSVEVRAEQGTPFNTDPYWVELANSQHFNRSVFMDPWTLPPGAYGNGCGPS